MTALAELNAITLTANAKTVVSAKAVDIAALTALVKQHVSELKVVLSSDGQLQTTASRIPGG
jgi:hypothetical protein